MARRDSPSRASGLFSGGIQSLIVTRSPQLTWEHDPDALRFYAMALLANFPLALYIGLVVALFPFCSPLNWALRSEVETVTKRHSVARRKSLRELRRLYTSYFALDGRSQRYFAVLWHDDRA
jgi:hypothetical protein